MFIYTLISSGDAWLAILQLFTPFVFCEFGQQHTLLPLWLTDLSLMFNGYSLAWLQVLNLTRLE